MAASVSKLLAKAEKKVDIGEKRLARLREENEQAVSTATRTAVTMGGALGMAWIKGRYPDKSMILGLDSSLVVGGGLTLAALMGWAGDQELVVEALGNGALATYAASKGFALGKEAKDKAPA